MLLATPAAAQERPELVVELRHGGTPEVLVSVRGLLDEDTYFEALESGFPLYLEYRVALRAPRTLWDRTVAEDFYEYVVLHDPVRERFTLETPGGTEYLPTRPALRERLAAVHVFGLPPDGDGTFYYEATVTARMLTDDDVDEAFAWLKSGSRDSARLRDPGFFTRLGRRLLLEVAPLPQVTLNGRTRNFRHPS